MELQEFQNCSKAFGIDLFKVDAGVLGDLDYGFSLLGVFGQEFFVDLELGAFGGDYFEHNIRCFFWRGLGWRLLSLNFLFGSHGNKIVAMIIKSISLFSHFVGLDELLAHT